MVAKALLTLAHGQLRGTWGPLFSHRSLLSDLGTGTDCAVVQLFRYSWCSVLVEYRQ